MGRAWVHLGCTTMYKGQDIDVTEGSLERSLKWIRTVVVANSGLYQSCLFRYYFLGLKQNVKCCLHGCWAQQSSMNLKLLLVYLVQKKSNNFTVRQIFNLCVTVLGQSALEQWTVYNFYLRYYNKLCFTRPNNLSLLNRRFAKNMVLSKLSNSDTVVIK